MSHEQHKLLLEMLYKSTMAEAVSFTVKKQLTSCIEGLMSADLYSFLKENKEEQKQFLFELLFPVLTKDLQEVTS